MRSINDDHDGYADHDAAGELLNQVARAADLCLRPWRHGVRFSGEPPRQGAGWSDCSVLIEVRDEQGRREVSRDLELEIYLSGEELNLMLSWNAEDPAPVLWHGSHPVWMDGSSGERCPRPADGAPLEALCRRLRAVLQDAPSERGSPH